MANRIVLSTLAVVVLGGGAAFYFLSGSTTEGLDSAGRRLMARITEERERPEVDTDACRELLKELLQHPAEATNRELIRGHAWLELLLGRLAKAWELIEPNLGIGAVADDQLLGARIMERRFAASGDDAQAHRAAVLAQAHFDATRELSSLFLAWQMQVRREDRERRDELAGIIQREFATSEEAKLVQCLAQYPDLREEAPGAEAELRRLADAFPVIPAELDLALAMFEVEDMAKVDLALERVDRVLRTIPSSTTAKTIGALGAMRQENWPRARALFEGLLRQAPNHRRAKLWRDLLAVVETRAPKKN